MSSSHIGLESAMGQPQSTSKQGTYAYRNRVRNPFRVLLAIWRVTRDMQRTDEAGIVDVALDEAGGGRV